MEIKPYTPLSDKYKPLVENRISTVQNSPYRPRYHIAPPCGLLNDPNGLCYKDGKYHVFYQWYPFEAKHDMKHWNHVVSDDFINWDEDSEILIPNESYEKNGCYSGNAYVSKNKAYLYYTANYKNENGTRIPQQALAIMDENGKIEKSNKNPIINKAPELISENIRDPFVFTYENNLYMLLGAETLDHKGCVLLYKAYDFENWEYQGILDIEFDHKKIDLGTMVECPGLIQAKEDILFLSLIGSQLDNIKHENRFDTIVLIGTFNPKALKFEAHSLQTLDYGFDFYAPQPFYGKDEEPIFFGWFGCANDSLPEDNYHWRHALTLPRNIIFENSKFKTPVQTGIKNQFKVTDISEETPEFFTSSSEPTLLKWKLINDNQEHRLKVGNKNDYWELIIDFPKNNVRIDRTHLKTLIDPEYGMIRSFDIEDDKELLIELFLDNSFNELYVNNGEKVLSFRSYESSLNKN